MAKLTASYTYTDAELLDLAREAFAKLLAGEAQEYRVGSRTFRKIDLADLERMIGRLEVRVGVSTSSTSGSGIVRAGVSFIRPE